MPIALATALPTFVSQDEYSTLVASTPSSFNDIPPVLRHKQDDVSVSLDPALDGFSAEDAAQGTLYVLTSALVFMATTGRGFQIDYPTITLHAISRGESPSIYCQLDESVASQNDNPSPEDDDVSEMRELSIIPRNPDSLEPIFEALSQCAALHPDKEMMDEDDLDDAFIEADGADFETFTGDEDQELSEVGRAALAHLESIIYDPYEDAATQANGGHKDGEAESESETGA